MKWVGHEAHMGEVYAGIW